MTCSEGAALGVSSSLSDLARLPVSEDLPQVSPPQRVRSGAAPPCVGIKKERRGCAATLV